MLRKIWLVAYYTFLEGVRARFFIGAIVTSVIVVIVGSVMASVPYGRGEHLIGRLGTGAIFLTGIAINIFYAVTTIARERDTRILNLILAKPVTRWGYALGKFGGLYLLMFAAIVLEALLVAAMMYGFAEQPRQLLPDWIIPALSITLKCGAVLAFACFSATVFVTQFVAMAATATYFLAGTAATEIVAWARYAKNDFLVGIGQMLQYLTPQFPVYDFEGYAIYEVTATPALYMHGVGYFLGYTVIAVAVYLLASEWQELS